MRMPFQLPNRLKLLKRGDELIFTVAVNHLHSIVLNARRAAGQCGVGAVSGELVFTPSTFRRASVHVVCSGPLLLLLLLFRK